MKQINQIIDELFYTVDDCGEDRNSEIIESIIRDYLSTMSPEEIENFKNKYHLSGDKR